MSYIYEHKHNVMFTKGLFLSGTNIGVDGRTFDNPLDSKYLLTDTFASRFMLNEYSLKASLLEQHKVLLQLMYENYKISTKSIS